MGKKKPCGIERIWQDQEYIYESSTLSLYVYMYCPLTVVIGASGTGKTFAASNIKTAKELGKQNEVKTNCDLSDTVVLMNKDDYDRFKCDEHNKLIIMDNADVYVNAEIAEFIKSSDNAFIIMSRANNKYLGRIKTRFEQLVEFTCKSVNGVAVIKSEAAL